MAEHERKRDCTLATTVRKHELGVEADDDSVLRAMSDDGSFRVITARTTRILQSVSPRTGRKRSPHAPLAQCSRGDPRAETMAPTFRVKGSFWAQANAAAWWRTPHPDGGTRGLIDLSPDGSGLSTANGALLQVMRTLPSGELRRGVVEGTQRDFPPPSRPMLESEHVVSTLAVSSVVSDDGMVGQPEAMSYNSCPSSGMTHFSR